MNMMSLIGPEAAFATYLHNAASFIQNLGWNDGR